MSETKPEEWEARALAAEAERDEALEQAESFKAMYRQACDWRNAKIAAAEAASLAKDERIRELEEALEPFAKAGELFPPREPESFNESVYMPAAGREYAITGDDLRRARSTKEQP